MTEYDQLSKELFTLKESNRQLESMKKDNNKRIQELQYEIMDMMESEGVEKLTTEFGTMSRRSDMYPQIDEDTGGFDGFLDWIVKTSSSEFIQKRINRAPVKEFYLEHGTYPPGVKTFPKDSLSLRINSNFRQELNTDY